MVPAGAFTGALPGQLLMVLTACLRNGGGVVRFVDVGFGLLNCDGKNRRDHDEADSEDDHREHHFSERESAAHRWHISRIGCHAHACVGMRCAGRTWPRKRGHGTRTRLRWALRREVEVVSKLRDIKPHSDFRSVPLYRLTRRKVAVVASIQDFFGLLGRLAGPAVDGGRIGRLPGGGLVLKSAGRCSPSRDVTNHWDRTPASWNVWRSYSSNRTPASGPCWERSAPAVASDGQRKLKAG